MKRFLKSAALLAVLTSVSLFSSDSFARGTGSNRRAVSHPAAVKRVTSHRINLNGNGPGNPDKDPNYPSPSGPGGPPIGPPGGGNPNPVKPHPMPVQTVPNGWKAVGVFKGLE